MSSVNERLKHYKLFSSPTPDSPIYEDFMKFYEQKFKNDPNVQKKSKGKFEQAISILNTQLKNGTGLLFDTEFRYFLIEFNARNFQYGFGSMPSSFNVLEGFLTLIKIYFYSSFFQKKIICFLDQALEEYRINKSREFFQISFENALKIISPIIESTNEVSM